MATHEDLAYRELTRWIELLLESARKAEGSVLHHLNACQISYNNAVTDTKTGVAARERLQIATKCLAEAERVQQANWNCTALLELVAGKSMSIETRLHLTPSVQAWIDEAISAGT